MAESKRRTRRPPGAPSEAERFVRAGRQRRPLLFNEIWAFVGHSHKLWLALLLPALVVIGPLALLVRLGVAPPEEGE